MYELRYNILLIDLTYIVTYQLISDIVNWNILKQ